MTTKAPATIDPETALAPAEQWAQMSFDELASAGVRNVDETRRVVLKDEDRASLIGVPFIITDYTIRQGSLGEYVSVELTTRDGRQLVLNDGSQGYDSIMTTVMDWDRTAPLLCPRGLGHKPYINKDGIDVDYWYVA